MAKTDMEDDELEGKKVVKPEEDDEPEEKGSDSEDKEEDDDESEDKDGSDGESEEGSSEEEGESEEDQQAREELRQRRREEKRMLKQRRKEAKERDKAIIAAQDRQLREMRTRLEAIENRTASNDLAQLDAAITQQTQFIDRLKGVIQEGIEKGDGRLVAEAQTALFDTQEKIRNLTSVKQKVTQAERRPPAPDPMVSNMANQWVQRNSWYSPASTDPDSRIVTTLDNAVAEDGFDPRTPEYWEELDRRIKRYLPHRFVSQASRSTKRPPQITGGSGKASPSPGADKNYGLSSARIAALKEAGMWDDEDTRKRMIKQYQRFDKES